MTVHQMLTLEQEGERLHKLLNDRERQSRSIGNKAEKYFDVKKEYENSLYIEKEKFRPETKLRK